MVGCFRGVYGVQSTLLARCEVNMFLLTAKNKNQGTRCAIMLCSYVSISSDNKLQFKGFRSPSLQKASYLTAPLPLGRVAFQWADVLSTSCHGFRSFHKLFQEPHPHIARMVKASLGYSRFGSCWRVICSLFRSVGRVVWLLGASS